MVSLILVVVAMVRTFGGLFGRGSGRFIVPEQAEENQHKEEQKNQG
jgi:hypothetical protein